MTWTGFMLACVFWGGFTFLMGVGVWTIRTLRQMRQTQVDKLASIRENTKIVEAFVRALEQSRP